MLAQIFRMASRNSFKHGITHFRATIPYAAAATNHQPRSMWYRAFANDTHSDSPILKPRIPYVNSHYTGGTGSSSSRMMRQLAIVGTSAAAAAVYVYEEQNNSDALESIVDIESLNRSFDGLTERLEQHRAATVHQDSVRDFSLAINEAVKNSNLDDFDLMFDGLIELLGDKPGVDYQKQLVHHLAQTGKVSFLRHLCLKYNMHKIVAEDKMATLLLNHPDCETIEAVASKQFWPGPGSIRNDGARTYLVNQHEEDLQFVEEAAKPDVTGVDVVEDISLMLRYMHDRDQHRSEINQLYNRITVMPIDESGFLLRYAKAIKKAAEKKTGKTTFPFVLTGAHYTYGQIEINNLGDGQFEIKSLYVDSLGASIGTDPGSQIVASLIDAFPDNTKIKHYTAENKIQHSENGCSIFALNDFRVMLHADEVLPNLPQYRGKLPQQGSLWAYMDMYDPKKVKGKTYIFRGNGAEGFEERTYDYHLATLPLAYSRQKQSLNRHGRVDGYDLERAEREGYEYKGHQYEARGQMGIHKEVKASPKTRRKELNQPYRHDSSETPQDYLDAHVNPNARGKMQNQSRDDIYEWGHKLVSWLLSKPRGFVHVARRSYELEEFIDKHCRCRDDVDDELSAASVRLRS